jgi:nucleoside-diphosphate-sugar epimerase
LVTANRSAVSALLQAPTAAPTTAPVFNVCTGKGTTVRSLAETMAALHRTELVAFHRRARPERRASRSATRAAPPKGSTSGSRRGCAKASR